LETVGCGCLSSVGHEHLDLQLAAVLGRRRGGFFIEAGANDGITQSNTYYLEKILGWKGLLIEPLPVQAERCRRRRPKSEVVNAALVRSGYPNPTVTLETANLMSVVNDGAIAEDKVRQHVADGVAYQNLDGTRSIEVPARTLESILDQYGVRTVDLFSLDVEGYELEVLKGINFDKVDITHILIESRAHTEAEIRSLLGARGYRLERGWLLPSYQNLLFKLS